MRKSPQIVNGILFVSLSFWPYFHSFEGINVPNDLAPQEYNISKDKSKIPYNFIKISVPGNTITAVQEDLPNWFHNVHGA